MTILSNQDTAPPLVVIQFQISRHSPKGIPLERNASFCNLAGFLPGKMLTFACLPQARSA
jgi:hypothetical protein